MASSNQQVKLLKGLIWVYLVLLLTEGALRKWMLPSLSNTLVIVRDPVVILIYMVAMASGRFVVNGFVAGSFLLAAASFCASLIVPDSNLVVTLIGLRCYFLHLPLIFVMERTLEKEDIWRMGKFLLWFAIPESILLFAQLRAPQTAWVNLGLGGQVTEGFSGALDKFRPSGTFSFTTCVGAFYPLVVASLLGFLLTRRKLPLYLSIMAGVSVIAGIYASINRTNAVTCALVLLVGGLAMLTLSNAPKQAVRLIFFLGAASLIASLLPHFDEGVDAFNSRWESATGTDLSGFQSNIVMRFINDLMPPFGLLFDTPVLGYGVGSGTQMAQAYLSGQHGFALGESEWPRLILEMGPVLGLAFIFLRIGVCIRLVRVSLASLRQENIWPLLFAVEACFLVLNASWGQATILGFATFSAGLAFASSHMSLETVKPVKIRRRSRQRNSRKWQPTVPEPTLPVGAPSIIS